MKKAAILNIGTELLVGHVLNTHAQYLTQLMNSLGYAVHFHMTCGDNPLRIKEALSFLDHKSDLIVVTGGLGPTLDDVTREVVADFYGLDLDFDQGTYLAIKGFFDAIGRDMTDNNRRQAYFPKGALILDNPMGTAPGFYLEGATSSLIALPGPPKELHAMCQHVLPNVLLKDGQLYSCYLSLYGIGESALDDLIKDIFSDQTDPTIGIYALEGQLTLRVSTVKMNQDQADRVFKPTLDAIRSKVGSYLYSEEGETLAQALIRQLKDKNMTISFAESCTGGLLSKGITDVSGSSQVFNSGLVTYSNQEKSRLLGVSEDSLTSHGAVSEQVAQEMVRGLYEQTGADLCVAVTGIAGPNGGTETKPVGLVYVAYSLKGQINCVRYHMHGDRERIRMRTAQTIYKQCYDLLNG